jgi:hypothetical protein
MLKLKMYKLNLTLKKEELRNLQYEYRQRAY